MEVAKGFGGVVDLAENIIRAFNDPELFQEDEDGNYGTDSYHLPFPITDESITPSGRPKWDAMDYVRRTANVQIMPGETDSFGWLTAVITPSTKPAWAKGKNVYIVYG